MNYVLAISALVISLFVYFNSWNNVIDECPANPDLLVCQEIWDFWSE